MWFVVAVRQKGPVVSDHVVKLYSLYYFLYVIGVIKFVTSCGTVSFPRRTPLYTFL